VLAVSQPVTGNAPNRGLDHPAIQWVTDRVGESWRTREILSQRLTGSPRTGAGESRPDCDHLAAPSGDALVGDVDRSIAGDSDVSRQRQLSGHELCGRPARDLP